MASNPYVNKVVLANGTTVMDISGDTLTSASQLMDGVTAHDRTGRPITGTWSLQNVYPINSLWATYDGTTTPATVLGFGTWVQVSPIEPTWNRLKQTSTWAQIQIDEPTIFVWKRTE